MLSSPAQFLIIYSVLLIPYSIAFGLEVYKLESSPSFSAYVMLVMAIVTDLAFILDMISMFYTPIMSEFGTLNYDKNFIAKQCARTQNGVLLFALYSDSNLNEPCRSAWLVLNRFVLYDSF
eukprot:SAG11_NODE_703_length_7658_cov_12.066411_7_plen_121_part_00